MDEYQWFWYRGQGEPRWRIGKVRWYDGRRLIDLQNVKGSFYADIGDWRLGPMITPPENIPNNPDKK